MSFESARDHLKQFHMDSRIKELDTSSATVELAANAIGCPPSVIAKSLTFKVDERAVLIVAAGDAKIDNPKFKSIFNTKAKMLTKDEVEELIGHSVGGVCPFGIKNDVDVYLDISLRRFNKVFPACGSSNSLVELSLDELEKSSKSISWIDTCKHWE